MHTLYIYKVIFIPLFSLYNPLPSPLLKLIRRIRFRSSTISFRSFIDIDPSRHLIHVSIPFLSDTRFRKRWKVCKQASHSSLERREEHREEIRNKKLELNSPALDREGEENRTRRYT